MTKKLALIIEDDYDASVIFSMALEDVGLDTKIVRDGRKALEALSENTPDIVVLDLHLPNVIGTDILKFIRASDRLQKTLVILATADPRLAETVRDDADMVLLKPITFTQVRDFSARLIRRKADDQADVTTDKD